MRRKTVIDGIVVAALVLVVVVGYRMSPLAPKVDMTASPEAGCDLHRNPCTASLPGGGGLRFSIAPHPIPMMAPLQLEVALIGRAASKVEVDFSGVDMNMGLNRSQLATRGEGIFTGEGRLPICATGRMDWQATVLVESGRERIAVPFRFTAGPG